MAQRRTHLVKGLDLPLIWCFQILAKPRTLTAQTLSSSIRYCMLACKQNLRFWWRFKYHIFDFVAAVG